MDDDDDDDSRLRKAGRGWRLIIGLRLLIIPNTPPLSLSTTCSTTRHYCYSLTLLTLVE